MRPSRQLALFLLASFPCAIAAVNISAAPSTNSEVATIYETFLNDWIGNGDDPINVAESANAPTADDLKQYAECVREIGGQNTSWIPASQTSGLRAVLGNPPHIRFVDPKKWRPLDPDALMASGASVGPAVSAGVAQGLITLSAITFNPSHDVAVFTFSFNCGSLCGTGRVVVFKKTQKGWTQSRSTCGGWMS